MGGGGTVAMPIRIHPQNHKLFEFRGEPLVLLTATEHYGAVLNRPFRFEKYLDDAAEKGITLTRLFTLFRELQSSINPYSTCKPESPDYVAPFERTGPGRALDGEPKFDLTKANPEFFDRLHSFVSLASDRGIIVEVVFLSNTYNDSVWALNPLNPANNLSGLDDFEWPDYMSQRHPLLFDLQAGHSRRVVQEINKYDNVIFEICNEPGGRVGGESSPHPTVHEVNDWLSAHIRVIRKAEEGLPNQHLIAGQEAFLYDPFDQPGDLTFGEMDYDIVNMHPLPKTSYKGKSYHLGDFMSKQLQLRALRDYGLATYAETKPLNQDEDNIASQYKDVDGWTIHRKRAWTTLLTGGHYDYIDFSIVTHLESGTPESNAAIRTWMLHLSTFIHSFDLVRARPLSELVASAPEHVLDVTYGVINEDVAVYLADERELKAARGLEDDLVERHAGEPISGELILDLPDGNYGVSTYDPRTGICSPCPPLKGGVKTRVAVPEFIHDLVLRFNRTEEG
jgi:hypothetical protein